MRIQLASAGNFVVGCRMDCLLLFLFTYEGATVLNADAL